MKILVTGGTGFIGSHTVVELINEGYEVVIVDNLSNSKIAVLDRIEKITSYRPKFYEIDLCDKDKLEEVFKKETFDSVIHFAGLKSVSESVSMPNYYYHNNIESTLNLTEMMIKYNVKNIIFSSSATVYGTSECPIDGFNEDSPIGSTTNPYGTTKYFIERILIDIQKANPSMNVILLRYFNPIGAHKSGLLGEDPNGIPNNLLPYVTQVAIGKLPFLKVTGADYPTKDGTGVRDYIHVVDLALGHLAALKYLKNNPGVEIFNLGNGVGRSVLDVINAFNEANNLDLPYQIYPRRPGDIATCFANVKKANTLLSWEATHTLQDACRDSWNFQKQNPKGIK